VVAALVTVMLTGAALLLPGRAAPAHPSAGTSTRSVSPQPAPQRIRVRSGIELLDARTGARRTHIPTSDVRAPVEVFYDGGSFWVFDAAPPSFVRIDPVSGAMYRRFRSPIADVGSFTVRGNTLWITDERGGAVTSVDATVGHVLRSFTRLPGRGGSVGVVLSHGSLWVSRPEADRGNGILVRLNPVTGRVERRMDGLPGSYALTTEPDGTIWTAGTFGDINRIDPVTNDVVRGVTEGRNYSVAAGDGFGWTADGLRGVVYKVDANGDVVGQYPTARGARAVSYSNRLLWVGNTDNGTVTRIDASGGVITYRFDRRVLSLAAGSGAVLVEFGRRLA
jgi:streptogramin lyase